MIIKRVLCVGLVSFALAACFIDNPNAAQPDAGVAADGAVTTDGAPAGDGGDLTDGAVEAAAVDAGPSLCTKYGGYATMEVVVGDLFGALVADCRISKFFTVLTSDRQGHLYDCLVKQVAVVMGCPGIKYDVDNNGLECRDMQTSHKGLSIRSDDFDALVQDLVTVMLKDGVAQSDIDAIAPRLLSLRSDIVENSAPGNGHAVCDAGGK